MNALTEWVRNLVVLVFVLSAAQLLLPTNSMRPYVRFVLGLVVISVLLTSLFDLTSSETDFGSLLFPDRASESAQPYIERGTALATTARARIEEQNDERVTSHVMSVATIVLGAEPENVFVEWAPDGAIRRITVVPRAGAVSADGLDDALASNAEENDRTARIIAGFLGLEQRQVFISTVAHSQGGLWR